MSDPGVASAAFPMWSVRRAALFLVMLQLPFAAAPVLFVVTRRDGLAWEAIVTAFGLALAIGALQLRHSLAEARGERPIGWAWTFGTMVAIVYVPVWALDWGWDWAVAQWFVVASSPMVLRGRAAVLTVLAVAVGTMVMAGRAVATGGGSATSVVVWGCWYGAVLVMGGSALFGSARLIRVVDALSVARNEIAELAVGRERQRMSRDLHDLLGQSLSAVSLKGDLALRLLPSDPLAARAEIEGITGLARGALRDARAVAHDRHEVSLEVEIEAAAALLSAAGIETLVRVDFPILVRPVEEMFAWAVREGATNALRHSDATRCSITSSCSTATMRLEVLNDGVDSPIGVGSGLAGLVERARGLGATASGQLTSDGGFRLVVEIPAGVP